MGGRSVLLTFVALTSTAALGAAASQPGPRSVARDAPTQVLRSAIAPVELPTAADAPDGPAGESGRPSSPERPAEPVPPSGPRELEVVAGTGRTAGEGRLVRFIVEVEEGTGVDGRRFAAAVEDILLDPRGWTRHDGISLRRVSQEPADIRVTLAFPETVDRLCRPLDTRGTYSCWNEGRALINLTRWLRGAATYGDDLANYRRYLINHEVGHGLGHGHVGCTGDGDPAPVMLQQTIDLGGCRPNPWPIR